MERIEGVYCALWTPTDGEGKILWEGLERHLSFVLESGAHGIMALGSTGEFVHLTLPQRKELLERITQKCHARGRGVIANVSDVQFRNVVELARHAKGVGANCISVLPPWYFPLEQRDVAEFFIEVARSADVPLALYNYPEVTGKRIEIATIERVARQVRVVAVKQSGAEFGYHEELLRAGEKLGFTVVSGADTRFEEVLGLGCSGTVSGMANLAPEALVNIYRNFRKREPSPEETRLVKEVSERMKPLLFPLNVMAAVAGRGFESGSPKGPLSAETRALYEAVVRDLSGFFQRAC